jgi:hypothetical protein
MIEVRVAGHRGQSGFDVARQIRTHMLLEKIHHGVL